jgi:glutathione synthase/RimK-type ligase-like ATP-grasp enzyme
MRFVGITREAVFSPGRVDDDAAILLAVAQELRANGHAVEACAADDATWPVISETTVVFTMAQGDRALAQLRQLELRGVRVVNSTAGILNCQRHRTVPLLTQARVAFPSSQLLATDAALSHPASIEAPVWVKRGDVHATESDDVVRVESTAGLHEALRRFHSRGIAQAVVQRHVPGTVLKFYAVRGSFFHCVPPDGGVVLPAAVLAQMDVLGQQAAHALGVEIYGGDCVYDANGGLTLIDLNDWPSYARCRFAAATAIAAYVGISETKVT